MFLQSAVRDFLDKWVQGVALFAEQIKIYNAEKRDCKFSQPLAERAAVLKSRETAWQNRYWVDTICSVMHRRFTAISRFSFYSFLSRQLFGNGDFPFSAKSGKQHRTKRAERISRPALLFLLVPYSALSKRLLQALNPAMNPVSL
jgi:hypothetical protein